MADDLAEFYREIASVEKQVQEVRVASWSDMHSLSFHLKNEPALCR